jgi:catechol 2,3-dioxygenase-like lactoylglutathione lyase family enzyme
MVMRRGYASRAGRPTAQLAAGFHNGERTMIGYATIGSNDLEKAKGFYDTVLVPLGGKRAFASDRMQGYAGAGGAMLAVCTPYDGEKAVPEVIKQVYDLALANGGTDEGAPGDRGPGFHGAYFRDLDGNKVCVFKMG